MCITLLGQTDPHHLNLTQELKSKLSGGEGMSQTEVEVMVREEFAEQKRIDDRKLNIMCFGLEESTSLNIESRKKEDENTVKGIIEEVLGVEEEFNLTNLVRIGRPVTNVEEHENENMASGSLDGASDSRVNRKKIRPLRLSFADAESKKKVLRSLRDTINETSTGKYKYIFFQQDLTLKQRELAKAKRAARAAAKNKDSQQQIHRAQQGCRDQLSQKR